MIDSLEKKNTPPPQKPPAFMPGGFDGGAWNGRQFKTTPDEEVVIRMAAARLEALQRMDKQ